MSKLNMKTFEWTLSIINLCLIIFGTIGNLLTFLILLRKNVYKHSCMRYLAALCLIDTFCLYTWNFSTVYSIIFRERKIEHEGVIYCRLFSFYNYFMLQSSSWIMCAIGMDRIATVTLSTANKLAKVVRNTRYVIFVVVFACFCLNIVVIVNNAEPFVAAPNSTSSRTYSCYEPKKFFFIWDIVHIVLYSLLPFSIIFAENIFLAYLTKKHTNKMNKTRVMKGTISSSPTATNTPKTEVLDLEGDTLSVKSSFLNRY